MLVLRPHQQRALEAMQRNEKGQIIVPTGGGKTLIAIMDALRCLKKVTPTTLMVVAPRILLANQLCGEFMSIIGEEFDNVVPIHVHSGETPHFRSTDPETIKFALEMCRKSGVSSIIFTTYHSLRRVQETGIAVNTVYFDESHNSVQKHFFPATHHFSMFSARAFFFTATPKHSAVRDKAGMNMDFVYGDVIAQVTAPELVEGGYLIPPEIYHKDVTYQNKSDAVLDSLRSHPVSKVLVAAKSVKQFIDMLGDEEFVSGLTEMGFSILHISAKHGSFIDGNRVSRDVFFDTLNKWGSDNDRKFIVFHHSILSEGISVSGLEAVIFLRNMNTITLSQTIGRVIRLHNDDKQGMKEGHIRPGDLTSYVKPSGICIVPGNDKVGIATSKRLEKVADTIFVQGQYAKEVIKR